MKKGDLVVITGTVGDRYVCGEVETVFIEEMEKYKGEPRRVSNLVFSGGPCFTLEGVPEDIVFTNGMVKKLNDFGYNGFANQRVLNGVHSAADPRAVDVEITLEDIANILSNMGV